MLLSLAGRRVYYDLNGPEAAPVVCFTHSLSSDSGMWAEQMPPLLAAGFRVLRLDMRGHGGSEPAPGSYTMAELAGDVAAALDALGIAAVHYIGLSIGGMLGQAFAIRHGGKLASMMLCDTLPASPRAAKAAWDERTATVQKANSLAPLAESTMERWFTAAFKAKHPARWRQIHDTIVGTTPAGFAGCAAAIQNFDFVADLPKLSVPALVVCGDEDPGTPPSENRRIAGLVPGARYEGIAAARHMPNVEQPEAFNRIMLGWLDARRR
jgi:3-oxoadipate enol-lactonase